MLNRSINQSLFFVCPKVDQRAGQLNTAEDSCKIQWTNIREKNINLPWTVKSSNELPTIHL